MRLLLINLLAAAALTLGSAAAKELPLLTRNTGAAFTPDRLSVDSGGEVFVLDRAHAQLYRFSSESGRELWRVDGSEGGEPFIDPLYVSRGDGFFVYLTDRGSRKVWRIDYRGEIRGSLELPFASDPTFFELAAGHQMLLYDRASALVHLLDDSGRSLLTFPPGGSRNAAEPLDIAVSRDGERLYVLWPGNGGVSVTDLSGRSDWHLELAPQDSGPVRLAAADEDYGVLVLTRPGGLSLYSGGHRTGGFPADSLAGDLTDICNVPDHGLYQLADNPPRLILPDHKESGH